MSSKKELVAKDISQIDLKHSFFHYTNQCNLDSIFRNGLEPRIGESAAHVEKTPKIFFVEGEKGIIAIMDVWLKWLIGKINGSKFIYWFGTTFYLKAPFLGRSIPNRKLKRSLSSEKTRLKAYVKMKEILENSVFLVLDLEEGIDFSYDDIDEVKQTYYASFLKLLYPYDSDLKDCKIEYWNMHTYSNHTVNPQKIALLKSGNTYSANQILTQIIESNVECVKANYQFLYEYYLFTH